MQYLLTAMIKH